MRAWIATLLLAGVGIGVAAAAAPGVIAVLDPASQFEFSLQTRWGQTLAGKFPDNEGDVTALPDGRRQVRLKLSTRTLEILDHPRYTRFARGPRFFDAERFPDVTFLSDPYPVALLHSGGELHGRLRMHGVERRERFVLSPAECADPGRGCAIVARGAVRRSDYDLDGWSMAMRDEVRFSLHVRLRDTGAR
ncbi:YceI family protein [Lysobacter dokdonensis DS-58]|uniref:YceI family protein n=1 Tax=Lysobacter dokdonensis DS-58 TaxID=1300345 RepID=A0A0A2WPK5_9GAMM|nr:YceI family protein [Lysobacter dokdonensis]KGQ20195.1 YceI family protein [Lysobacter dokdonensis DS-58]